MTDRDEYVRKLKAQIDEFNAEAARWEERARKAQAGMKAEYERQLENYRKRSSQAVEELRRLQNASIDAWTEMMRGVDESMKSMREAFERAQKSFDKNKK